MTYRVFYGALAAPVTSCVRYGAFAAPVTSRVRYGAFAAPASKRRGSPLLAATDGRQGRPNRPVASGRQGHLSRPAARWRRGFPGLASTTPTPTDPHCTPVPVLTPAHPTPRAIRVRRSPR